MGDAMHAETVLRDGMLHTQDAARPHARAVAIAGGRIVAFDDAAEAAIGPGTRVIALDNRAVVPGFVDAHIHFTSFALARQEVDLDAAPTLPAALHLIANGVAAVQPGAWLKGRGWDRNRWGRLPTAGDLDSVTGERPAVLSSHDGHAMWLNSAALRAAGIDRSTTDVAGGVIERDSHGEPAGVLFENAQDLVRHHIPRASQTEIVEAVRQALPIAAGAGLTGIHNFEDHASRDAFAALEAAQQLSLRVYHGISRGELKHAKERGLTTGAGSEWLRIGPVKLFSDGALGSRTAHLLEPYARRTDGYRGVPTLQPEEMDEAIRLAHAAELDVAIHAIGDAAVRSVLDAYARTRAHGNGRILRIEHAQLVHPEDVPRFEALDVVASMQPIHAAADWRMADAHWGTRSRYAYAWRSLLDAGATLAFGTDAPVEHIEPLLSMYAAATRRDLDGEPDGGWYPAQRVTLAEAIAAYTLGSARAENASDRRGSLRAGNDADLVVLEPDPFSLPAEALRDVHVALTMVGGRIVFEGG